MYREGGSRKQHHRGNADEDAHVKGKKNDGSGRGKKIGNPYIGVGKRREGTNAGQ